VTPVDLIGLLAVRRATIRRMPYDWAGTKEMNSMARSAENLASNIVGERGRSLGTLNLYQRSHSLFILKYVGWGLSNICIGYTLSGDLWNIGAAERRLGEAGIT
jgi:hypothetical protein